MQQLRRARQAEVRAEHESLCIIQENGVINIGTICTLTKIYIDIRFTYKD